MQAEFKNWLISQGFKEYSASGNRSTVLDYLFRINKICQEEGLTWVMLSNNIDLILPLYETGGEKHQFGKRSHESVLNALRNFKKFATTSTSHKTSQNQPI